MTTRSAAPRLEDVAQAAKVSTATVSRCLNDPEKVSKATRERVLKAVQTLGYTPNFAARVMAAKRSYTIGAIIPTMENAIFARGLQIFQEELHRKGYTLLVASSGYSPKLEEEQIRTLVARGADGILLIGLERAASLYAFLRQQGVPALAAWGYAEDAPVPCIGFDNFAAMQDLTNEILDMGHQRVAMISGVSEGNDRAGLRLQGFLAALEARGLQPAGLCEVAYSMAQGARAFEALMAQDRPPSAIACGNDVLAAGALRAARQLGLAVPQDVSITGFDDIELARIVEPPLTTMRVPHKEMGRKAAHALISMVEGETVVSERLATQLKRRQSL